MTVGRLIELLQKMPPHLEVIMSDEDVFADATYYTLGPPAHMHPFPEQREVVVIWPLEETDGP
jgi:hypothetical protein